VQGLGVLLLGVDGVDGVYGACAGAGVAGMLVAGLAVGLLVSRHSGSSAV